MLKLWIGLFCLTFLWVVDRSRSLEVDSYLTPLQETNKENEAFHLFDECGTDKLFVPSLSWSATAARPHLLKTVLTSKDKGCFLYEFIADKTSIKHQP